jgi:serpin B
MPSRLLRRGVGAPALIALALVALALLAACDGGLFGPSDDERDAAPERITGLPRELSASEAAVIGRSNGFAFDLLRQVAAEQAPGTNVFLSPLSASMALGMLLNGAGGQTHDEIRDMLGFEGMSRAEVNAAYRGLTDLLVDLDPSVDVQLANSVWYREGFAPAADFLSALDESFDAEVSGLDFSAPDAAATINAWVESHTNGRIDGIVEDPIDAAAMMFLLNAVYFNAPWTEAFDFEQTAPRDFTLSDGSVVEVPTMVREPDGGPLLRGAAHGWIAVEMPYGGEAYAMTLLLPQDPSTSVDDLLPELDAGAWSDLVAGLAQTDAGVEMPRFRISWEASLKEPLQALGMREAFGDGANLDPMTGGPNDLHVSKVKQKIWVDVHEEGTEAAAVTSIEVRVVSAGPTPPIRIDRPFVAAIRERYSGTILFLGVIEDPREA